MTSPASLANRGVGWELVCSDLLDRAEAAGLLVWHRFPVPVEQVGPVKRGGRFEAVRSDRASPDLLVVLGRGAVCRGMSILAEWKECAKLPWHVGAVAPHQANAFDRMCRVGGRAVVLLRVMRVGAPPLMVCIDWADLAPRYRAWAAKESSGGVSEEDVQKMGVVFSSYTSLVDALDAGPRPVAASTT
ncbi:MAG: hypothetical protein EBX36_05750, partial [Planctomycetia bacterium]|nr:hypothetical protein [Planctomycetia bacterium]